MPYFRIAKNGVAAFGVFFAITSAASAFDGGDAVKGEKTFKKCASCHMVGDGAKNKVGPVLNDVFGRSAGSVEDYKYGKSIIAAGEAGLVWNEEEMFEYLADPRKYLRAKLDDKKAKSKMSFRLKKEDERKDVIAYIRTFSPEAASEEGAESEETESTATN
ncbi:MAG: cytochrome c family protein [Pseudomonadota bacterium]